MRSTVKEPTTSGGSVTVALPDTELECPGAMAALNAKACGRRIPHFFDDPIDVRRVLIAKRNHDGHDTPLGHTYSNIIEILDGWLEYQQQHWATHPSQTLAGKMNYQIGRLERLSGSAGG